MMQTRELVYADEVIDDNNIQVDNENYGPDEITEPTNDIYGVHAVDNQLYYLVYEGGDWEYPVTVCYYYDLQAKLHRYIPIEGNTVNKLNNAAFGNGYQWSGSMEDDEPDLDIKYLKSVFPDEDFSDAECAEEVYSLIDRLVDNAKLIADVERHLRR